MKTRLYMPKTERTGIDGINDGNIETYKNNPMLSLTKEELQNSTDNAGKNEDGTYKKVIVEFSDFLLNPRTDLNDYDFKRSKKSFLMKEHSGIIIWKMTNEPLNFLIMVSIF